tara:strand:- start:9 stop:938 length:930 start_codon:yes stop_codon:yes gene_type:complete
MTIAAGGPEFTPGSAETLTIEGLSTTASSAVFRYSTLEVDGADQGGGEWDFDFSADDSAFFAPTPNRFDCQVVYDDGTLDPVVMTTGERKIGTVPSAPGSSGQVTSITPGTGMSSSPDPITTTGTINLDASLTDLNDVDSVAPAASGQVLVWDAAGGNYEPSTPSLSDNSDFSSSAPADGDALTYDSSSSDWGPTAAVSLAPSPGSSITLAGTAYSPAQDAQAAVKRQTFYHAASSGGTGGGAATLIASGVEFVLKVHGWWEVESSGARELIEQKWIEFDGSSVDFNRSTHPGAAGDGFFLTVDFTETV